MELLLLDGCIFLLGYKSDCKKLLDALTKKQQDVTE
jgi:hypothetical protein